MKKEETNLQEAIINKIKSLQAEGVKIDYDRRQTANSSYKKGSADIWVVFYGIHIEVEIKTPTGERSALQETWERWCNYMEIPYMLVKSVDDFVAQLFQYKL